MKSVSTKTNSLLALATIVACACMPNMTAQAQKAEVYTTDGTRTYSLTKSDVDVTSTTNVTDAIVLKPSQTNQSIDGFGFAITYSSCYNLLKMSYAKRHELLVKTYSVSGGYGVSYARISLGCNDFSSTEYTYCDTKGSAGNELRDFRLYSDETNYVIPILKEILAINPDVKIIAAPWTCPKWMKVEDITTKTPKDSWTDGHLNPDYYQTYADYFVKFIQAMADEGISIYAVTPQNEPLNRANCASLYMPWKEEAAFVKVMAKTFKEQQLRTKIYLFDHNYNYDNISDQNDYPIKVYNELGEFEGSEYLVGAAYHNYGGTYEELVDIHWQNTEKELIFTEASIGDWNNGRDLDSSLMDIMENISINTTLHWCRAALVWNFMLDKNKGPNLDGGCQTCYGAIDIETDYQSYTLNSHYYAICHMAAVVRPGAYRIDTEGWWTDGLSYAAFRNPDGSLAIAFCNKNATALDVKVSDGTQLFTVHVPARSAVSCRFNIPAPTFGGNTMTYEEAGVYTYTGTLTQDASYTVGGRTELNDTDWFYDSDFLERISDDTYKFRALTGRYTVKADFNQGKFTVYAVNDDGSPLKLDQDGDGAIWVTGGEGTGKRLYLVNGYNWDISTKHALCMSQIRPRIYQITFASGRQLQPDFVNFKFFYAANEWNQGEFKHTNLTLANRIELFGIGTGADGHDDGNIYCKTSKLDDEATYTFIIDCTDGPDNAILFISDGSEQFVGMGTLPSNLDEPAPYPYMRTFSSAVPLYKPVGTDVYIVEDYKNGTATLSPIDHIPANTGVILGSKSRPQALTCDYTISESPTGTNLLVPTVESTYIEPSVSSGNTIIRRNYLFGYYRKSTSEPYKLGFWRSKAGMSGAQRAYLQLAANDTDDFTQSIADDGLGTGSQSKPVRLVFDGNATGIVDGNVRTEVSPADFYTLQGVRLTGKPNAAGIYINKGRKIVVRP